MTAKKKSKKQYIKEIEKYEKLLSRYDLDLFGIVSPSCSYRDRMVFEFKSMIWFSRILSNFSDELLEHSKGSQVERTSVLLSEYLNSFRKRLELLQKSRERILK